MIAVTDRGSAPVGVFVSKTPSTNNLYGIRSIGENITVRVRNSNVVGNGIGLSASGGGIFLSMGQNELRANGTKGAFTDSISVE